jgi:cation transport ATPase
MSSYEETLRASFERLSDEELLHKVNQNHYTEEAEVIARKILLERGMKVAEPEAKEILDKDNEIDTLTLEQQNSFNNKNAFIWFVSLYIFGLSQMSDARTPLIFTGLLYGVVGTLIYFIVIKIRAKKITIDELKKKYKNNYGTIIFVIGLAAVFSVIRAVFAPNFWTFVDVAALIIFMVMLFNRVKFTKQLIAVASLIPAFIATISGDSNGAGIWAFAFFVAAQSLLIEDIFSKGNDRVLE